MYAAPFTIDLPQLPAPLAVGDPVFVLERGDWFVASACITAAPEGESIRVQYRVPPDIVGLFGNASTGQYASSGTDGIEELVATANVVSMRSFVQASDPAGGRLQAGTIVALLRPELFRVQLGQIEAPFDPGAVAVLRLLVPSQEARRLEAGGAPTKAERGTFVSVAAFADALQSTFDVNAARRFFA